jgi:hypothetical protein
MQDGAQLKSVVRGGLWTMSGTRTVFHNEGGTQNSPKVYKVQIRPSPLAN